MGWQSYTVTWASVISVPKGLLMVRVTVSMPAALYRTR